MDLQQDPNGKSAPDWGVYANARIPGGILEHLRKGEPWVFRDGMCNLAELCERLPQGGWVRLATDGRRGKPGGLALFDAENAISLRVLDTSRALVAPRTLLRQRLALAHQVREPLLRSGETTAVRAVHGEGDRLPGLTADYYDGLLVYRPDCGAWLPYLQEASNALGEHLPIRAVYLQYGGDKKWIAGTLSLPHDFQENGHRFGVHPALGQKSGFFLDMRPNRAHVERISHGLRVLNVFAYTGAFTVYALRGGAARVVNVDSARAALEAAKRHVGLAGHLVDDDDFIVADAFEYLETMAKVGATDRGAYDLIILDPPSFAHSRKSVPKALEAYVRLNTLALQRLGRGQYLATASCSSRVSPAQFAEAVARAARDARRRLRLLYAHHAGEDHPVAVGSGLEPYLKFHHYLVE